ncbi:MAG TPA: 7-cyano-7-deazaguanine synthase QueC [Alphaproteobacteria bacterium]|nr:7-cyano-7-deazaguanine synthase QueC [Alphaproteobacteria bacterium]
MIKNSKKAVILLSGGLDSATACALAKANGFEIYAISFDYGQRHKMELTLAAEQAKLQNIKEHKIIKIDLRIFGASALTSEIDVPKNRDEHKMQSEIPITYVPARNTIFLSYALAYAEVLSAFDIFIGVNAVDYSGYPDCRPEYIKAFEVMANLATKTGVEGKKLTIHTPLIDLTKAAIIKKGTELGVDYSKTTSCYDPSINGLACGVCDSCNLRLKGFSDAGLKDKIIYYKLPHEK